MRYRDGDAKKRLRAHFDTNINTCNRKDIPEDVSRK
jgi:hypothetical protein